MAASNRSHDLLPTTVVGSHPQPDWLVDRALLARGVPRTRLREVWRVPEGFLEQARDDATLLAIRDVERGSSIAVAGVRVRAGREEAAAGGGLGRGWRYLRRGCDPGAGRDRPDEEMHELHGRRRLTGGLDAPRIG